MDRDSFLKILAERFYPLLRAEAFRGSGTTLRRVEGPVVNVINMQGSSSADGFYVNLGVHLTFLISEGGRLCVPSKLKEYECAFRERIHPPPGVPLGRWPYGHSDTEGEAIVAQLTEEWHTQGHSFFKRYSPFPEGFADLVRRASAAPPHPRDGLTYARIAVQLGLRDEAAAIARQSLTAVSEGASGLRATLKRFVDDLEVVSIRIGKRTGA